MKGHVIKTLLVLFLAMFSSPGAWAAKADSKDARHQMALHYFRGVLDYQSGNYEEATNEFSAVADVDPYYKDTQKYLKLLGDRQEDFLRQEDRLGTSGRDVDLYLLGKHYYEKGDPRKALEAFNAILKKSPNDKFALYYKQLIEAENPAAKKKARPSTFKNSSEEAKDLAQEISYMKEDVQQRQEDEDFLGEKARHQAERDELIQKKERQLDRQEQLLEEDRQDYLAEEKISARSNKLNKESEKWHRKKEALSSKEPGVPVDLTDYPEVLAAGEEYYTNMREALRESRWNSAGLNGIEAAMNYCDAILIYFYGIRSAYPQHDNLSRLLTENVHRDDVDENVVRLRAILNLKSIIEDEDRPLTRSEAIFLAEKVEQIVQWCRTILP